MNYKRNKIDSSKMRKNKKINKYSILFDLIKKNYKIFFIAIIIILLSNIVNIIIPIITKNVIDIYIKNKDLVGFYNELIKLFILIMVFSLITFFNIYTNEYLGQNILFSLKKKVFDHLIYLPSNYFDKTPVGKFISRIESDGEAVRIFITNSILLILNDIILFIGMLIVMINKSPVLTLFLMIVVVFLAIFSVWYKNRIYPIWEKFRKVFSSMTGVLSDIIKGSILLKLNNLEGWGINKLNNELKKIFILGKKGDFIDSLYHNTLFIFESLTIALIIWITVFKTSIVKVNFSVGLLYLFTSYIRQFFGPIKNLTQQYQEVQKALAALSRIEEILNIEKEDFSGLDINDFKDKIVFNNVSFSYDNRKIVLKNVSFTIKKGEKVALVGKTGSGKTTIISILLRLYDGYKGSIKIDGIELKNINKGALRNLFSTVFQDIFLFEDNVKNNITIGKNIDDDYIFSFLDNIGIKEYFKRFSNGLYTNIGNEATNISTGEKQLVSIVRTYLRNSEIFIFDEATASIDRETEDLIYKSLNKFSKDKTCIIIAHKLSTIKNVDKIIVFHNGEVIEEGSYNELVSKNGYFAELVNIKT
ncbi:MAG: ABC transporter ATP-binding protein/permease [Spirochaetes bacterium]|nr:ABC transporter ATP-binding protein/permease [Spirochaetota bacterium]